VFPNASLIALQAYKKLQKHKQIISSPKKKNRLINILEESPSTWREKDSS